MKKTFRSMMLLLVGLLCSLTAAAQGNYTWETLTVPSTISLSSFTPKHYVYTATENGVVTQTGCGDLNWYTYYAEDYAFDPEMYDEINVGYSPMENTGWGEANEKQYEVTAGTTYYLFVDPMMDYVVSFTFSAAGEGGEVKPNLRINEVDPAQNTAIGAGVEGGAGEIVLILNFSGVYDYVVASSGDLVSSQYSMNDAKAAGFALGIEVKDALLDLYNQGMQAGDDITFTVFGVKDTKGNLFDDTGIVYLEYKALAAPLQLLSTTFTNRQKFYSYYAEGDPEAVYTFTFDGPLDTTVPYAYQTTTDGKDFTSHTAYGPVFELGCVTDSDSHYEYVPTTVSGNVVTVDFSGHNFGDFLGLFTKYNGGNNLSFKLMNVFSTDGQMALGDGSQGAAGSYNYEVDYVIYENDPSVFAPVWTPADGGTIAGRSTITLTLSQGKRIAGFTAMKFSAGSETATVPAANCTISMDGTKKVIECPIPAGFSTKKNVIVSLTGILSGDGYEYDDETFVAVFNMSADNMTFNVTPASGSSVSSLSEIKIETNAAFQYEYPSVTVSGGSIVSVGYISALWNEADSEQIGINVPLQPGLSLDGGDGFQRVAKGTTVTITFPARAFMLDTTYSPELVYTYTIGDSSEPQQPEKPEPNPEYSVTLVAPIAFEEDGSYETSGTDDFRFEVSNPDFYILAYDLFNVTKNTWIYGTTITEENGVWTAFNPGAKFIEGNEYAFYISAYDNEDALKNLNHSKPDNIINAATEYSVVTFNGSTPGFPGYSTVQLVSISPENESTIEPADNVITLTFSDSAEIDLTKSKIFMPMIDGNAQDPIAITSKMCHAVNFDTKVWAIELDPEAEYMTDFTGISMAIYAKDDFGKVIQGNTGMNLEEEDFISIQYTINNGADLKDVMVEVSDYSTLSHFQVYADGFNIYPTWNGSIYLQDSEGTKYFFNDPETIEGVLNISLPEETVLEEGDYTLVIPERALRVEPAQTTGEFFNREYTGLYTLVKNTQPGEGDVETGIDAILAADPEAEVYNLQGVRIAKPAKGQLVIVRQGNKATKTMVK